MAIFLAIIFLCGALCYPYVRVLILRRVMLRRFCVRVRKMGYRIKRKRHFLFSANRSRQYDLLLLCNHRIWAIKLWSSHYANASLVVDAQGKVCERRPMAEPLQVYNRPLRYHRTMAHSVPRTRLNLSSKESRPITEILLVYPSYQSILVKTKNGMVPLKNGMRLFDKILCSPAFLEHLLKETANSFSYASKSV